jgi:hypothetical protein
MLVFPHCLKNMRTEKGIRLLELHKAIKYHPETKDFLSTIYQAAKPLSLTEQFLSDRLLLHERAPFAAALDRPNRDTVRFFV